MVQLSIENAAIRPLSRVSHRRVRADESGERHAAKAETNPVEQLTARETSDGQGASAMTTVHGRFLMPQRTMTNSSKFMMALTTVVIAAESAAGSTRSVDDSPIET